MASLKELSTWESGIYQIEENDPVHGGADGITNKPIKQLANRTLWLNNNKLGKTENAVSASKLQTARTINGVAFDGSQDITIVDSTKLPSGANAVSASKLATARTINFTGAATGSYSFDGSENASCVLTLANSGVAAGSYGNNVTVPVITVNEKGLVTVVSNHTIRQASTTATGIVQLADSLTSTATNQALTAAQGKVLNDKIDDKDSLKTIDWVADKSSNYQKTGFYRPHGQQLNDKVLPALDIHITHPTYAGNAYARGIGFAYGGGFGVFTTSWDKDGNYMGFKTVLTEDNGVMLSGNQTIMDTKTFNGVTNFASGLRLSSSSKNTWATLGVGAADVFLHNPVSNRYLQLKDDSRLTYSGQEVYHQGRKPRFDEIDQVPNLITNPTRITEGDLNTYTDTGFYYYDANVQAAAIANTPSNRAFSLEVVRAAGVVQFYREYQSSNVYVRGLYGSTWSPWTRLATVNDNAPTATKLQTARTINGIAFDGSQDITIVDSTKLPSNGNATSASKLQTARTLSLTGDATASLTFDGSANVSNNLTLASSGVTAGSYNSVTVDAKGRVTRGLTQTHGLITATTATGTANTATTNTNTFLNIVASGVGTTSSVGSSTQITGTNGITVSSDTAGKLIISQDIANNLTDTSAGKSLSAAQGKVLNDSKLGKTEKAVSASTADTATKLQTARTINGIAFDGTTNITIADDTKLPSGANAVSATKLVTARRIDLAGAVTGNANFDGSANITINTALKAVQRTERTGTLIPTNNSFKNLTVDVAGVVEVYPDGRIVQSFSFVAPVRYFHRHSAQAFYRTTLGIADFTAGEDNPILEMPLWTAMPNKVSEARVHLSSGPAHHAYSEANEWIYDWDAIFNQQANIKDKAYFSFRRWTGGSDEPVTFNIVVEGY